MTTYNNLEIAQVSMTFSGALNPSISARTFDLSTLSFLPNVPLIDQIEIERIFDTGYDTKFSDNVFTIADRRQIFILPKAWYSINEQTKILTVVDLSTIPTYATNSLYYPDSRTFVLETLDGNGAPQTLDIPNFLVNNVGTNTNGVVRQPDTVVIRRKTLSIDSIVTFAPGTRLTTTQLNLQFNQLKYILQELVAKVRNEIILKFDENAIDGPFLGGSDLKMSNNYIKDLNSISVGEVNDQFSTGIGNSYISGATYAANIGAVNEALTKGTVRRTTMNGGSATPFSGHFTATPVGDTAKRITLMADAVDATDAATLGQVRNATNIITGTLTNAVLSNIPLTKLSGVAGQGYTLPADALANSGATAGSYGVSTAGNTNNMVYMTVDAKGRVTTIASRNMAVEDLPTSGVTAATYGQSTANNTNNMLQLVVDSKGRITGATQRNLGNNDLPTSGVTAATYGAASGTGTNTLTRFIVDNKGIITSAAHRSIEVNDLPDTSVTGAGSYGQTTAGNTNNMLRVTYDAKGRITSATQRNMGFDDLPSSIPLSKLSGTLSQGYTLPKDAIADGSILFAKLDTTTAGQGTIPLGFIPTNIPLNSIDSTVFNTFSLPNGCLANTGTAGTFGDTQPALTIVTDTKGRVTSITPRNLTTTDIPSLDAGKITTGTFDAARIPTSVVTNNAVYWDSGSSVFTAARSSTAQKIRGVASPTDNSDAVPLGYFNTNALVSSGGVITANGSRLTGLGTPTPGTAIGSDAVNFALLESVVLSNAAASGTLIGSTLPQVYRTAAPTPTANNPTTGWNRYAFAYVDGTNPLYATTSTMVIVEIEGSSIKCVPQTDAPTAGTVFNGWFYLDISGATKTVYLYTNSSITGTNVIIRNFGLSRLVSGAAATTASAGLVSIFDGTEGGIAVTGLGAISLKPASSTQIGGIKQGTGLTITSGVAAVNLTDTINTSSSSTAASATAVNTLRQASMLLDGTQAMTGKLSFVTPTSGRANMLLPSAALDPTTLVDGDLWHNNGILKFRSSGATKTIAFLGDNVATASALQNNRSFSITGAVTAAAVSFNGTGNVTLNTSPANDSITLGTHTIGNYVAAITAGTGLTLSGTAGEGTTFGLTNSDRGSSQLIYGTVALSGTTTGDTSIAAASNTQTLTLNAGTGVSLAGNNATKTITITNTATQPNNFGTVIVGTTPTATNLVADSSNASFTVNAGTGISLSANATTDTLTINNAGVTGLSGTTDQVTVTASTGSVTLGLPQSINTTSTPTFGSVTAKNLTLGSSNNTIISTDTNGNINLDPNGTGIVNIQSPLDVDGTLNVDGATTLVGDVTINSPSTLTLLNTAGKISLGAASSTTSINRQVSTASPATAGDLVLRVPTSGKAWLVANDTIATAPVAANEIVTQAALTTALSSYATTTSLGTYMAITGNLTTGSDNQVLGTGAAATGSFIVKTADTARLTINSSGVTSLANGLGVTGAISATGKISSAATVGGDSATVVTTKGYVDGLFSVNSHTIVARSGYTERSPIGWAKAGPLYFQWGRAENLVDGGASGGRQRDVYFPVAFPTACLSVQLHPIPNESNATYAPGVYAGTITTTKFEVGWAGSHEDHIHWFAIGY